MNKFRTALLACFYGFASICFVYVFFMSFFWNRQNLLALTVGFIFFLSALVVLVLFLKKRSVLISAFLQNKRRRILLVLSLLALFACIQSYFARQLMMDTLQEPWDIWVVREAAAFVAEHPFSAHVPHIEYFQRCENNQFILAFLSGWFWLCRAVFGPRDYEIFGAAISVLSTTLSMGLTYLAAKNFFGVKNAFFTLAAWFFFIPFYSHVPFYYTDLLCLPFITAAAWFLSCFYKTHRLVWPCLAGIAMGLGGQMKGTLYVFLIAGFIWLLFADGVSALKRVGAILLCALFVAGSVLSFKAFYEKSGVFGENPVDHEGMALPITHYLSMAQSPNGPYDAEEREEVIAMGHNYAYRSKKCWDSFYGRLVTRGLLTDLLFTNKKVIAVWGEGSYQTNQYPRPFSYHPDSPWLLRFNNSSRQSAPWFLFMNVFHFTLLFSMLGTLLYRLKKRCFKADGLFLWQLSLLGMFLFELFWEWRSRYLLGYVPFLLCMLPFGLDYWGRAAQKLSFKRKQN